MSDSDNLIEVKIDQAVAAPLERVWALLADFGNLDWYDSGNVAESEAGSWRKVSIPGSDELALEKIIELDERNKALEYSVEMPGGFFSDYRARVELSAAGDACHILWRAWFVSVAMPQDDAHTIIEDVYTNMLGQLERAAQAT